MMMANQDPSLCFPPHQLGRRQSSRQRQRQRQSLLSPRYSPEWLLSSDGIYEAYIALGESRDTPAEMQAPCFGLSLSWPASARREAGDLRYLPRFRSLFDGDRRMQVLEVRGAPLAASEDHEEVDELRRLFLSDVLPNHPHLRTLVFEDCRLSSRFLEGFVDSLLSTTAKSSARPLRCLEFRRTKLDPASVRALCRLLQHQPQQEHQGSSPLALEHLRIEACGLSTESSDLLLRSLRHNSTLLSLVVTRNYVHDISPEAARAVGDNTTLQALVLEEPMLGLPEQDDAIITAEANADANPNQAQGDDAPTAIPTATTTTTGKFRSTEPVEMLARALRSHPSLQVLHVPVSEGRDASRPHPFEGLLERNFVLADVRAGYEYSSADPVQRRVGGLLVRNRPYQDLREAGTAVGAVGAWPRALSRISSRPEWIASFLRHPGNLAGLAARAAGPRPAASPAKPAPPGGSAADADDKRGLAVPAVAGGRPLPKGAPAPLPKKQPRSAAGPGSDDPAPVAVAGFRPYLVNSKSAP